MLPKCYPYFQQTVKYEPATHGYGGTSNYKPRSFDTRPGASPSPGIESSSSLMIRLFKEEQHHRHYLSLEIQYLPDKRIETIIPP